MSDWLTVIVLGVIEGVTEFLPISSTGHLLVAQHWLKSPRSDLFNVVIQCGTVLAVLLAFSTRVRTLCLGWREAAVRDYLAKLMVAFVVTGVGGLGLKACDFSLPERAAPVAWALLVGGAMMLGVERWLRGKTLRAEVSWMVAVAVGLAQLVAAVFPGTSRSGASILVALAFGLQRPLATEFSFLLGIPTLLSAGLLESYGAWADGQFQAEDWSAVVLASVVAAATAFVAVKWLLHYVQSHTFDLFGWYRLCLGGVILLVAG